MPKLLSVVFSLADEDDENAAVRKVLVREYIKEEQNWWSHIPNFYLMHTEKEPDEVANKIRKLLGSTSKIVVMEIDIIEAHGWLPEKAWRWINKHIE